MAITPISPLSDAELVARALAGSEDACRDLVRRFERPVYALILRMVGDAATAEDLAQEAFVKAFRNLATYDPQRKLASWLFKIAHNTTLDHLRRGGLATVPLAGGGGEDEGGGLADVLPDTATAGPAAAAERHDLARALETAIAALRPEYREAVVLRYVEELSYEEIAEATALPLGTVKTFLHRARKALAVTLSAAGWGPETGGAPGA